MNNENNGREENSPVKKEEQNIEWDNGEATYGHSVANSEFKRKNTPAEEHTNKEDEKSDPKINEDLKNSNLSKGEDIGNRNSNEEKGIGGKSL